MRDQGKNTLLVVDDDPYVLEYVTILLKELGYAVYGCRNACDAVNLLKEIPIDAVLTDINMPQVGGIELLRDIRSFTGMQDNYGGQRKNDV